MTPRAVEVLRSVSLIAAEDTRHSGKLRQAFGISTPMVSYHQHNRAARELQLMEALDQGDVALISDAGTPGIADPGHDLIAAAIEHGHRIVPIPGASSLLAAIAGSALVPGPFVFLGFVERSGEERRVAFGKALATGFPLVLFESPLRTAATLAELAALAPGRSAVVARELTKLHEEFIRGSLADLHATYAGQAPRGEVVIVIGGEVQGERVDNQPVDQVARAILASGVKPSKAARELAAITGIDGATAYEVIRSVREVSG